MNSIKDSISTILSSTFIGLFVILLFFIGLKGCVISVWTSPIEPEVYFVDSVDERALSIIFLPEHEALIWYNDPNKGVFESSLMEIRGTYGTHYWGRFWKIEGPGITFGYRIFPPNTTPVVMELKIIQKYREGVGESTSPSIGKTIYETILLSKDSLFFQDSWLYRINSEDVDLNFIQDLYNTLIK